MRRFPSGDLVVCGGVTQADAFSRADKAQQRTGSPRIQPVSSTQSRPTPRKCRLLPPQRPLRPQRRFDGQRGTGHRVGQGQAGGVQPQALLADQRRHGAVQRAFAVPTRTLPILKRFSNPMKFPPLMTNGGRYAAERMQRTPLPGLIRADAGYRMQLLPPASGNG